MMMDFQCVEFSIDDSQFGFTIEFCDSKREDDSDLSVSDIINSKSKYLLIRRSYPEDEYEMDWYTVESSESEIELNQKDKIYVKITKALIQVEWTGEKVNIGLNLSEKEYAVLNKALEDVFSDKVVLLQ